MKNLKKTKTSWPTKAVMTQIYTEHLWGGEEFEFYSGDGSHNLEIVEPYLQAVISFLKSHVPKLSICDLGCGDFNVGQHLVPYTSSYIGIDIVDELIERNKMKFSNDKLEFHCLDIAEDALPKADCVILRQVLQHLSNAEIKSVVKKLSNYKFVIITEHLPVGIFTPNKDMITNRGNRLKMESGVVLSEPPFDLQISVEKVLSDIVLTNGMGRIETRIYSLENPR